MSPTQLLSMGSSDDNDVDQHITEIIRRSQSSDEKNVILSEKIEVVKSSDIFSIAKQRTFSFDDLAFISDEIIEVDSSTASTTSATALPIDSLLPNDTCSSICSVSTAEFGNEQILSTSRTPSPLLNRLSPYTYPNLKISPGRNTSLKYQVPGGIGVTCQIPGGLTNNQMPGFDLTNPDDIKVPTPVMPYKVSYDGRNPNSVGYYRVSTPTTPCMSATGSNQGDIDDSSVITKRSFLSGVGHIESHPAVVTSRDSCLFNFPIENAIVKHPIQWDFLLDNVSGMVYITEGSNSHIYEATWNNQPIIVKVCLMYCTFYKDFNVNNFPCKNCDDS